jgi:hypothetical protein
VFADRFGWTKDQVDATPLVLRRRLMVIDDVVGEVREERARRERPIRDVRGVR